MLISELKERAQQAFLEFAWRQWAQMGISANAVGFDRWAIDPEAMVLFTVAVARYDPRLLDEILDWIARNRRLLTMQRLRNLTSRFPVDARLVGAMMASAGEPVPSQWLKSQVSGQSQGDVPVFLRTSWASLVSRTPSSPGTATSVPGSSSAVNRESQT